MPVPPWDIHLFIAWSSPWSYSVLILGRYLICGQTHDGVVSIDIVVWPKYAKFLRCWHSLCLMGLGDGKFYASTPLVFNRYIVMEI